MTLNRNVNSSNLESMINVMHVLIELVDDCDDVITDTSLEVLYLVMITIPKSILR